MGMLYNAGASRNVRVGTKLTTVGTQLACSDARGEVMVEVKAPTTIEGSFLSDKSAVDEKCSRLNMWRRYAEKGLNGPV